MMKKIFSLILSTFLVSLLPLCVSAQIESIFSETELAENGLLVKQKNVPVQCLGKTGNFLSINSNQAQVVLYRVDLSQLAGGCEDEPLPKKAKRKPIYNYIVLIGMSYTTHEQWNKELNLDYLPDLHLKFNGTDNTPEFQDWFPYFDFNFKDENGLVPLLGLSSHAECVLKGILGGIEIEKDNQQTAPDTKEGWLDLFEEMGDAALTLRLDDLKSAGSFMAVANSDPTNVQAIYERIDGLSILTEIEDSGLSLKKYEALTQLEDYAARIGNWDCHQDLAGLLTLFNAARSICQKENIDFDLSCQHFELSGSKYEEIIEEVFSHAKKGNPEAMLWTARFIMNDLLPDPYMQRQPVSEIQDAIYYYLTLALQGNTVAAKELKTISAGNFCIDNWVRYQQWLNNLNDLDLISTETYEQQMLYIRTHIIQTKSYRTTKKYNDRHFIKVD